MTDGMSFPPEATPYTWDASHPPSPDILKLWTEVGNGIDKSQTVVWKSAVESLDAANKFLHTSREARFFVEKYMQPIISILVEQQPTKIGPLERNCVQDSLALAAIIVSRDLEIQQRRHGKCNLLDVLSLVFNKKKLYYKGNKGNWNNHVSGLPEVRIKMIDRFRQEQGFARLHKYMVERINTPLFPTLDSLHQVLTALADMLPVRPVSPEQVAAAKDMEDAAIDVARATMQYVDSCSEDALKKLPPDHLSTVQHDLQRIFDKLLATRRDSSYEFYAFWRALVLKLIKSPSLPLRLFGWQQVDELLDACVEHRPPPRFFDVSNAGTTFVNGRFSFTGPTTPDGYAQRGMDISYERKIPDDEPGGGGKKLTLFRCTMRSQQKWWFLSEADEEQPGTDRDIDYYQHKSQEHEETEPPPFGWVTCRNSGLDPPPQLKPVGLMVPPGAEFDTLEHQLAQWAIENGIIELVLGDSVHREIVSRSTALIKFLASMCERDFGVESSGGKTQNMFCLQKSHLLLAWKTCSRKIDAAVSAQIYQLLVSILPSCPSNLAIPLLRAVQDSLYKGKETGEYLNEVADFCSTLAAANSSDAKAASTINLKDDVRAEVLELLWSVLTHPEAASLKCYDILKGYVTNELRVEPKGRSHREHYLRSCVETLTANSKIGSPAPVDELEALRMVKLTHFVLEACPWVQAAELVTSEDGALPILLFNELIAFLKRGQNGRKPNSLLKKSPSLDSDNRHAANPLSERLQILRYVYGVSDKIFMSTPQLHSLWQLCSSPRDREDVMVFIASSSSTGHAPSARVAPVAEQHGPQPVNIVQSEDILSAAFTEDVCASAFLTLFCSANVTFQFLGEDAYRSFQFLYNKLRLSPLHGRPATKAAIDTLWRICLGTRNDDVASQAMKDLLSVYISCGDENGMMGSVTSSADMDTETPEESFGRRVFECLENVKRGLQSKEPSAEIAAERCLRILNAAIGRIGPSGSIAQSTLARLSALSPDASLQDIVACLPHSMRGQACYRRVGIMVKRTQNTQSAQTPSPMDRDGRSPSTLRFSLDLHPLETLFSIKTKVSIYCECPVTSVKPISVSGRLATSARVTSGSESSPLSLNVIPDDSIVDELGIIQGCEMVFVVADRPSQQATHMTSAKQNRTIRTRDLSDIFCDSRGEFSGNLFRTLLDLLASLPWRESVDMIDDSSAGTDAHKLVWDLLLTMPTNAEVTKQVLLTAQYEAMKMADGDAMEIDSRQSDQWSKLLDLKSFHRSVYVLLAIDAFLQPAVEVLSTLPEDLRTKLERETFVDAAAFRRGFVQSGGFDAVVRFFSLAEEHLDMSPSMARMGNAVALRILKCCLFGHSQVARQKKNAANLLDQAGSRLLQSLSNAEGLLKSLAAMVVCDNGISTTTISDVLKFLRLLFRSPRTAQSFVALPKGMAEKFLVTLLLWEGPSDGPVPNTAIGAASKVRKNTHDLISMTPLLADNALPWLVRAIDGINVSSESTLEYFDILQKLVSDERVTARSKSASNSELSELATAVCRKLASCPRPTSEIAMVDFSTGVLRGCLALLRAIIESAGGSVLVNGASTLVRELAVDRWSEILGPSFRTTPNDEDSALIDIMGVIFDAFLSPGGSSSVAICCDKESRQRGFDVVGAAARSCSGSDGYVALVTRVTGLISSAAPFLKHRWGQTVGSNDGQTRNGRGSSKYSGLRNQGCTCYMNSVLQQLFMMPKLRDSICAAPLPATLRSSGGAVSAKGAELVGKKVAMQWENGASYDALVEGFDRNTGMHTIRYYPMAVATVGESNHQQVQPEDIARLPPLLPDEFLLSEGRPGRETGVFEVIGSAPDETVLAVDDKPVKDSAESVSETEEEAASRHLMEEVQRTFIHLYEGSRGRCFDPRALVEACACLKLEFDVWQQNDASEFATKLLDRLETTLRRWAPEHFRYLDHTFGLKQTKQKICKECGLKTNREEKLLNVDCQIRGKSDIHEALGSMTEVEIMEGSNQVFCDRCKKNTDTILRTAISTLPNMLLLSLKRFDLDYNTFETVKLNSRCAFGQTLNMKQYTLEGLEAKEEARASDPDDMDTETAVEARSDEDYEYRLAGVLVHAGVAQGGHYYSFIVDRSTGTESKWYRFDDEDVTPFDPAAIEVECFGGKVKKETKWPNGQVHTVESEQYANALMLFYEKVKPTEAPTSLNSDKSTKEIPKDLPMTSGYDSFEPDVSRSNATHRWQTFLFDAELQAFLKGLLGLCRMSGNDRRRDDVPETGSFSPAERIDSSWRSTVVEMLLTFVFDVLLYSNERYALGDWVRLLEEILTGDRTMAKAFIDKLAAKTKEVSGNWLRTYLSDCPDQLAREAAVRIFSAAFASCLALEEEQEKLRKWKQAWSKQLAHAISNTDPFPLELGENSLLQPSALGDILSFLNVLIEASPRNWRYCPELSLFVRNLAGMNIGGDVLRAAMIEAMIPARLICLVIRDQAPLALKSAFPGASASSEITETQIRPETDPTPQLMSISGNHVMNPTDMNYRGNGASTDFLPLFEAIGALLGISGILQAPLVLEMDEAARGRQRVVLSNRAVGALRLLYDEWSSPNGMGMGQREIENYLQKCGVDSVPTQKIVEIMSKYPTTSGPGKSGNYLSFEGFLAYYQDTAQTNEMRVRQDLHSHGFRPDLSRRPIETRIISGPQGHEHALTSVESVAADVLAHLNNTVPSLGRLADLGLRSFELFTVAYSASEIVAEHILSAACFGKNNDSLIVSTLRAIYHAPTGWVGNEQLAAAIMVLRVLCALPDSKQRDRIRLIMQCTERPSPQIEGGVGLLVAARALYGARQRHNYPNDISYAFDRYLGIQKDLLSLQGVFLWMTENRSLWSWMERDLLDSHHQQNLSSGRLRDYAGRREGDVPGVPLEHHPQSDSEGMPGINDSEEDDDDDSRFEDMEVVQGPATVAVEGAGNSAVNGIYTRDGIFERASKFSRTGEYHGEPCLFSLFQCNVSNNTKHWYISIVPGKGPPGTSADTDFYSAPVTESCSELPPLSGWTKSNEGRDPPPTLFFKDGASDDAEPGVMRGQRDWNQSGNGHRQNGGHSYV